MGGWPCGQDPGPSRNATNGAVFCATRREAWVTGFDRGASGATSMDRSARLGRRADQPVVECGHGPRADNAASVAAAPAGSAQPDDRRDARLVAASPSEDWILCSP
jgi:hypothetical protein